jgi:hypothetical protein
MIFSRGLAAVCGATALWLNCAVASSGEEPAKPTAARLPQIIQTVPARGATDVPVSLTEIVVAFDTDMLPGYSWMSGPAFPETTGEPRWRDPRTCVLPVKLQRGRFYRLGLNSDDPRYQNFTNADGLPAPPVVLRFVTEGATETEKAKAIPPRLTASVPTNGAQDVDPSLTAIEVTFDKPMSRGMSWTGYGEKFPRGAAPAYWRDDRRTCVFPVTLTPDHDYELGLNDAFHLNFQSADGIPAAPVILRFKTRAATSQ